MSILLITHENDIKSAQALLEVLIADKRNVKLFKFPQHEGLMRQEIEACSADCVVLVSPSSVSPDDRRADFIALGEQICANGNALSVFLRSAPKPPTWQCRDYPIPKVRSSNWLRRWILQDLEYKDVCTAILQKEANNEPPDPEAALKAIVRGLAVIIPAVLAPVVLVASLGDISWSLVKDTQLLRQPSAQQRQDYARIVPGDCSALRKFVKTASGTILEDEAHKRLERAELRDIVTSEKQQVSLPLYLNGFSGTAPSQMEIERHSRKLCEGLLVASGGTIDRVDIASLRETCSSGVCEATGTVHCHAVQPIRRQAEWCP
jgi:hypothetical protein